MPVAEYKESGADPFTLITLGVCRNKSSQEENVTG